MPISLFGKLKIIITSHAVNLSEQFLLNEKNQNIWKFIHSALRSVFFLSLIREKHNYFHTPLFSLVS